MEMTWTIEYDDERDFFRVTTSVIFSDTGLEAMIQAVVDHEHWRPGFRALVDHRKTSFREMRFTSIPGTHALISKFNKAFQRARVAKVMGSSADFGAARQFSMMAENEIDVQFGDFMDYEQALEWLLET